MIMTLRHLRIAVFMMLVAASTVAITAAKPSCGEFSAEIMYIQDLADSLELDLRSIRIQLPKIFETLAVEFPNAKFAVTAFSDKPMGKLGVGDRGDIAGDVCYKEVSSFTDDISKIVDSFYWRFLYDNGGDIKMSQLDALYYSAMSNVGWSDDKFDVDGRRIVRIVIMSTHYPYHVAGDALPEGEGILPFPGLSQTEVKCLVYDYPPVEIVTAALKSRAIDFLLFLNPPRYVPTYQELSKSIGVNSDVQYNAPDAANMTAAIMESLSDYICEPPTTTTTTATTTMTDTSTIAPSTGTDTTTATSTTVVPDNVNVGLIIGSSAGGVAVLVAAAALMATYSPDVGDPAAVQEDFGQGAPLPMPTDREEMVSITISEFAE